MGVIAVRCPRGVEGVARAFEKVFVMLLESFSAVG